MMGEACDDAFRLFVSLCKDKYPGLPPELVPIAKKYGVNVAKRVQAFIMILTSPENMQEAMKSEFESVGPFREYVLSLSRKTGIPPEDILRGKAAREYYKWLRGLKYGESK